MANAHYVCDEGSGGKLIGKLFANHPVVSVRIQCLKHVLDRGEKSQRLMLGASRASVIEYNSNFYLGKNI